MDELICRHMKGDTSDDEERALHAWRRSDSANDRYYSDLVALLEAVEAAEHASGDLLRPSAEDLIRLAEAPESMSVPGSRRGWPILLPLLAAAVLALVALGLDWPFPGSGPSEFRLGAGEFISGPAEKATVTLGDGTVVRLAPASRLAVRDVAGARVVALEGRAYFAVAPMPDIPFRVETRAGQATALGTQFEVKVDRAADDLRVAVVEGRVAVTASGSRVEIGPGEMSTVVDGTMSGAVAVDVVEMVDWVGRFIAFHATGLREVARELEREYENVRVVVTDSALASQTVTGWYVDRSFEEVIAIVCGVVGASCTIQDGTATLRPRGARSP